MSIGIAIPKRYALRLMSSDEILDQAVALWRSDKGVSDAIRGPPDNVRRCETCHLHIEGCPGHFAAIHTPPVVQPIVIKDLVGILAILCSNPRCARVVVSPDFIAKHKMLGTKPALKDLRGWVKNRPSHKCPYCGEDFHPYMPIYLPVDKGFHRGVILGFSFTQPTLERRGAKLQLRVSSIDVVDPRRVWDSLTKITTEDCLLMGFNPIYYHPARFMTEYIPVAPPTAQRRAPGLNARYPNLIKQIHDRISRVSELVLGVLSEVRMETTEGEDRAKILRDMGVIVAAVAALQIGSADDDSLNLSVFKRIQRTHSSYLGNLQKKEGILRKYAQGARHNVSGLAVLTGNPWGTIGTVSFPVAFAMKVTVPVTVTRKNIRFLRSLVYNGSTKYPGATVFWRNGISYSIKDETKDIVASSLVPGDVVGRNVLPGDLTLSNRYPTLREESIDCLSIQISNGFTMDLPLAGCKKKNADFDGDTTQVFFPSTIGMTAESLMLQGNIKQFLGPNTGSPTMFGSTDVATGINALMSRDTLSKQEVRYLLDHSYDGQTIEATKDIYTPNEVISLFLPAEFSYMSNQIIVFQGEIVGGAFNVKLISSSAPLLHGMALLNGSYTAILFLENVTRIAYTINRIIAQSEGEELSISDRARRRVDALVERRVNEIDEYSVRVHRGLVRSRFGMEPKDFYDAWIRTQLVEAYAKDVAEILIEDLKDSVFARNGRLAKNIREISNSLGYIGQITIYGKRIAMDLHHASRSLTFFPRYLDTAASRGYVKSYYAGGKTPIEYFFQTIEHRRFIYDKGKSVADQGYFERKSVKTLTPLYVGYFGEVRGDSDSIISFRFGHMNFDSRSIVRHNLNEWFISDTAFNRAYNTGVEEEFNEMKRVRDGMIDDIIKYSTLTSNMGYNALADNKYISSIDFDAVILKHATSFRLDPRLSADEAIAFITATPTPASRAASPGRSRARAAPGPASRASRTGETPETSLSGARATTVPATRARATPGPASRAGRASRAGATAEELWAITKTLHMRLKRTMYARDPGNFINNVCEQNLDNFKRLYMTKISTARLIKFKYTKDQCKALLDEIITLFIRGTVQVGDNVGIKAALNITEPLTQAQLNAIHSGIKALGSISRVQRVHGLNRWDELTMRAKQAAPVASITLKDELRFDKVANTDFARKINTVRLGQLVYPCSLYISRRLYAEPGDKAFIEGWIRKAPPALRKRISRLNFSPFKLRININTPSLVMNHISTADIASAIKKKFPDFVLLTIIEETMSTITRGYVYFEPGMQEDGAIVISTSIVDKLIIQGKGDYVNASVIEMPRSYYKGEDGSLMYKPAYRVEANPSDPEKPKLIKLLMMANVDRDLTFSNDLIEMIKIFGIAETRGRLLEEMYYEASISTGLKRILHQHFRIYTDYIFYRGGLTFLTRYGLRVNDDSDALSKMVFEETGEFIRRAIRDGREYDLDSHATRVIFGVIPKSGTGLSQVRLRTSAIGPREASATIDGLARRMGSPARRKTKKRKKIHMARLSVPTFLEAMMD